MVIQRSFIKGHSFPIGLYLSKNTVMRQRFGKDWKVLFIFKQFFLRMVLKIETLEGAV